MNESQNITQEVKGKFFEFLLNEIEKVKAMQKELQESIETVKSLPLTPYQRDEVINDYCYLVDSVDNSVSPASNFRATDEDILSRDEYDELSKLSLKIDSNLQSIAVSQILTDKEREDIKILDEEINSLLESL